MQNVAVGLLWGIGITWTGVRASTIRYWVIGLPMTLLLVFRRAVYPQGMDRGQHRLCSYRSAAATQVP